MAEKFVIEACSNILERFTRMIYSFKFPYFMSLRQLQQIYAHTWRVLSVDLTNCSSQISFEYNLENADLHGSSYIATSGVPPRKAHRFLSTLTAHSNNSL